MRWRRLNAPLVLGTLLALALLIAMALPSLVEMGDYTTVRLKFEVAGKTLDAPLAPGQNGFLLGTDRGGRNLLPRVLLGMRLTLALGMAVLLLRAVIAIPLGLLAGWRGRWLAALVSAGATGVSAVPALLLVALVLQTIRYLQLSSANWYAVYVAALVLVGLPRLTEHVRSLVQSVKQQPHVEAATSLGATQWRIVTRHIFPVIRGDLLVGLAAELAWVLVAMGQLAVFDVMVGSIFPVTGRLDQFFTLERTPELGLMMSLNRNIIRQYWWPAVFPAVAMGLIIACFQLLADGLRLRWFRRG